MNGSQKVHFLIIGGAGGGLEDGPLSTYPVMDAVIREHHFAHFHVTNDSVVLEAVNADGQVLDPFEAVK